MQPLVLSPKAWTCMPRSALASWPVMFHETVVCEFSSACSKVTVPLMLESPRRTATKHCTLAHYCTTSACPDHLVSALPASQSARGVREPSGYAGRVKLIGASVPGTAANRMVWCSVRSSDSLQSTQLNHSQRAEA